MSPHPALQIGVAVMPRLLGGSLAALLGERGVEVVQLTADCEDHLDLLVVTPDVAQARAEVVVTLAQGPDGSAVATVHGPSVGPILHLDGLPAILDFIVGWAAHGVEGVRGRR